MHLEGDRRLLRVYIGESNRHGGVPLYEAIVQRARERGLAGATVLRGVEGFGARSRIHRASILRLSEDLPIVIEIVRAMNLGPGSRFARRLLLSMAWGTICGSNISLLSCARSSRGPARAR